MKEDWTQTLERPLLLRDGARLASLHDVRVWIIANISDDDADTHQWRVVVSLLFQSARGELDAEEVGLAMRIMLAMSGRLALKTMSARLRKMKRRQKHL